MTAEHKRPRTTAATSSSTDHYPLPTATYKESVEERAIRTVAFIRSLRFSVPLSALQRVVDRAECPKCKKHRKFICYDCLTVVHPTTHPKPLQLPLHVHVILHPNEHRSKATTLPASTVSPEFIHIHTYPDVPSLSTESGETVVLYPSDSATSLDDIGDVSRIRNVIFIDSTWQQSKCISRDARVVGFRHVRIERQESLFWRYQDKDPSFLATVEAIYYFLRQYVTLMNRRSLPPQTPGAREDADGGEGDSLLDTTATSSSKQQRDDADSALAAAGGAGDAALVSASSSSPSSYHGEVDDVLLYFVHQYILVQQLYSDPKSKSFCERHFADYVLRGVDWSSALGDEKRPPGDASLAA